MARGAHGRDDTHGAVPLPRETPSPIPVSDTPQLVDLLLLAAGRGWRIRNLSHGPPGPPFRLSTARKLVAGLVRALRGRNDERDVVEIGKNGFPAQHGHQGRIGVWIGATTRREFSSLLSRDQADIGQALQIIQVGESEAYGTFPATEKAIDVAAIAIPAFRCRSVSSGHCDLREMSCFKHGASAES